jgi:histidine triad (HIT) family protein
MIPDYIYDKKNVFYKIIQGEIPAKKLYEDDILMIINDINPVAELHFLAVPKGNYVNYDHFLKTASEAEILHFFRKINDFSHSFSIQDNSKILCNNGFGQSIRHFHIHIISGKILRNEELITTK